MIKLLRSKKCVPPLWWHFKDFSTNGRLAVENHVALQWFLMVGKDAWQRGQWSLQIGLKFEPSVRQMRKKDFPSKRSQFSKHRPVHNTCCQSDIDLQWSNGLLWEKRLFFPLRCCNGKINFFLSFCPCTLFGKGTVSPVSLEPIKMFPLYLYPTALLKETALEADG